MQELLNAALAGVNVPYTLLLGFVILYWLSVILGAFDLSAFDFDLDADADVDMEVEAGGIGGWFASALHFFNFGKAPFMLIMTVTILTAWSLALLGNHYLGNYQLGYALATAIPIIFIGLMLAKLITTPLIPLFRQINEEASPMDYIGQVCQLVLPASQHQMGQARVRIDDNELLIYVKASLPETELPAGAEAVVIRHSEDQSHYIIQALN
jgi:hypothetical protein